jgi:tRNA1Val (adenine37-N6)-methyltransferase
VPNTYFRFKRFTVAQDRCAMKVCTDACLFGAWAADWLQHYAPQRNIETILDIGTGTGLLALMLAQKNNAAIDAVEVSLDDFKQAEENFADSNWESRLNAVWSSIEKYHSRQQYDCIISNPPFYENDLPSQNDGKLRAKHGSHLTLERLFTEVDRLLATDGVFAILMPAQRRQETLEKAAGKNLFPILITDVKQTPKHDFFRTMILFGRQTQIVKEDNITIKEENNVYSHAFTVLLKDYYLYL